VVVEVDGRPLRVIGREAETLLLLVDRGARGVAAYDFAGGPPFRLPAYVFALRRLGVLIRTDREPHATGSHGRFTLEGPVRLVEVEAAPRRAGA